MDGVTRRARAHWIVPPLLLAACQGPPVSREQLDQEEQRLLAPLLSGAQVGCGELTVEMTANFYPNFSAPALDPNVHSMREEVHEDYTDRIWTNHVGTLDPALVVTLGEPTRFTESGVVQGRNTRFTVLNQVVLRIWRVTRELTLDVAATAPQGQLLLIDGQGTPRELTGYRVSGGVLQAR